MATEVTLPRLGQGMESGTIVRWLKSEGEKVEKGEPLYELDTEKVTQEVEADASGTLLKILVSEGEVNVGTAIAVLGEQGESVPEPSGNGGSAAPVAEKESKEEGDPAPAREDERERGREAGAEAETKAEPEPAPSRPSGGRVKASPLARRLAKEKGIDLASLSGTGPEGRIIAEDVERAQASPAGAPAAASAEPETVPLSQLRKTIARRMTEAWQAPTFQIAMTADMTAAIAARKAMVERLREGDAKPTFSDILTKACAVALLRHPGMNVHFAGDSLLRFPTANVGFAVALEKGLVVPVIKNAERKTIAELAADRAALVDRARSGALKADDLDGGTFTISNLGMFGVDRFVAVLNPPQAGILAVGAIEERAVVRDGEIVARPLLELTLSCDHRSVDGATASEFLGTVKAFLEQPTLML
jgi:pyruvate dehydrogenase E2 component (dihydrolipoamide acetyltransferase)